MSGDTRDIDPARARTTWRALEPIHAMIYFVPEAPERYAAAGLRGQTMGYFASRAAAMGPVPAETVVATFYNFAPRLIRRAIPDAWAFAEPAAILRARIDAADAALRRGIGSRLGTEGMREAARLARQAAESACELLVGRPLFAAHASLGWPDEPHLVLWHAQTLLREFRGDGHLAALLTEEVSGLEALVLHAASGDIPVDFLKVTRGWTKEQWSEAMDALRAQGLLSAGDRPELTESGRRRRQRIEDLTDRLAAPAYRALGEDGCARLREVGRPISRAVLDAGLMPVI